MDMGWKAAHKNLFKKVLDCRNPLPYGYGLEGGSAVSRDLSLSVVILCRMDMGWKETNSNKDPIGVKVS